MSPATTAAVERALRAIEDAFPPGPPPARDQIAPHDCEECEEIRARYAGRPWRTVSPDAKRDGAVLSLLGPEAFRYYLPAFLLASLERLDARDRVCETTIFHLAPDERVRQHHAESAAGWAPPRSAR